jgi:hypothetical protein
MSVATSPHRRGLAAVCAGILASSMSFAGPVGATEPKPDLVSATVELAAPYDAQECVQTGREFNAGCGSIRGTFTLSGVDSQPGEYFQVRSRMTIKRDFGCEKNGRLIGRTASTEEQVGWVSTPRAQFAPDADSMMWVQFYVSDSFSSRSPLKCPRSAHHVLTRLQVDDIWALVEHADLGSWEYQMPNPDVWVGMVRTPSWQRPWTPTP